MYLAIDIGGTKTLVAVFTPNGEIVQSQKFPTSQDYEEFLSNLAKTVAKLSTQKFAAGCVGIRGVIDRKAGLSVYDDVLPWGKVPIKSDCEKIFDCTFLLENDSKVAGLGAAQPFKDTYENIFYITVSTGIGGALITRGRLVKALQDMEIGKIPLQHEGSLKKWEDFAGGHAIVTTYGKRASEIEDPEIWHEIGLKIGYGLAIVCSVIQPDVFVFGGGVGQYGAKFIPTAKEYMDTNLRAVAKHPEFLTAENPEELVIYGCYELTKQHYEKLNTK